MIGSVAPVDDATAAQIYRPSVPAGISPVHPLPKLLLSKEPFEKVHVLVVVGLLLEAKDVDERLYAYTGAVFTPLDPLIAAALVVAETSAVYSGSPFPSTVLFPL